MRTAYPAIIKHDAKDGIYYVNFPDIEGCFTDGRDICEALENAWDVCNLMLLDYSKYHIDKEPPKPSDINKIQHADNEIVTLIRVDSEAYRDELRRMRIRENLDELGVYESMIEYMQLANDKMSGRDLVLRAV